MSDNLRRYRAIKEKLMQLHPHAEGRVAQYLTVLSMFVNGIVGSQSTHTRQSAKKTPVGGKVESRVKRIARWYRNERVTYEVSVLSQKFRVRKAGVCRFEILRERYLGYLCTESA